MADQQQKTLAQMVRAKFPGAYDDLSDQQLESQVKAKFPGQYDDVPTTPIPAGDLGMKATVNGQPFLDQPDNPFTPGANILRGAVNTAGHVLTGAKNTIWAGIAPLIPGTDESKKAGQSIADGSFFVNLGKSLLAISPEHQHEAQQMIDAAKAGNIARATQHAIGMLPLLGPWMSQTMEKSGAGKPAEAAGDVLGMAALTFGPKYAPKAAQVPAIARNANPVERAAVGFMDREGVPVSAGQATGNRFVQGTEALADQTPVGAVVAERAKQAQGTALAGAGERIAGRVSPAPATAESAGESIRGSLVGEVRRLKAEASEAYAPFDAAQKAPQGQVTTSISDLSKRFPVAGKVVDGRTVRAGIPNESSIEASLGNDYEVLPGVREVPMSSFDPAYSPRPYSPQEAARLAKLTGDIKSSGEVSPIIIVIDKDQYPYVLEGGHRFDALIKSGAKSIPAKVVVDTSEVNLGAEIVALPVDVTGIKQYLRQWSDEVARWWPKVQLDSSKGYTAAQAIINGPDVLPASMAERGLSALKSLAREAQDAAGPEVAPAMRNRSQGLAARVVGDLQAKIDAAAQQGGVADALQQGRALHAQKMAAADVLQSLQDEPVRVFRQATMAGDAGIGQLRTIAKHAPDSLPAVGRAWLDDALGKATAEGGFSHADALYSNWQRLGPETKRMLFPTTAGDLDQFFMAAKMAARQANPSRTALVGSIGAQGALIYTNPATGIPFAIGINSLSALLRSPLAVKALTQGLRIPLSAKVPAGIAFGQILKAADTAGVPMPAVGTPQNEFRQEPASPTGTPGPIR